MVKFGYLTPDTYHNHGRRITTLWDTKYHSTAIVHMGFLP